MGFWWTLSTGLTNALLGPASEIYGLSSCNVFCIRSIHRCLFYVDASSWRNPPYGENNATNSLHTSSLHNACAWPQTHHTFAAPQQWHSSIFLGLLKEQSTENHIWLVVSIPLKNISQWEGLSHILWITKKCSKPPTSIQSRRCNPRGLLKVPFQFFHQVKPHVPSTPTLSIGSWTPRRRRGRWKQHWKRL